MPSALEIQLYYHEVALTSEEAAWKTQNIVRMVVISRLVGMAVQFLKKAWYAVTKYYRHA